ncbi:MAG: CaCA family Na+/Ca+ antiporter, inner membrane protein [Candidatus Gottesmanbacteria bacterium GW2011_GWA2_43_14]|uniref:CaCA family Na+/Ca+ antiporter, inner membrane protein n=1 Tax=Candidatus Gottesmanbacteria bacterium GW2011_GWA2_43_14 TaxID=1618443 RepID=A0A0G1GGP1_9BACT|nr:MAG: CaCA family Na+/Ca+ antiporter, inner membrane protein [Candidatus Gottesmanbacteria bacterium GW2011_GWA2_43_14]
MALILLSISIITSILLISKGADWLTDSLAPIAAKLKTSNISIAIILVSMVVSLPEILVAVDAGLRGYVQISLGVIFGSIICNIGLMVGLPAMIRPLTVSKNMVLRDGIFSIVVPILIFAISSGGTITRLHGFALLLLFIPYLTNVFLQEKHTEYNEEALKRDIEIELQLIGLDFGHIKAGWLSFSLGLVILLIGTYLFSGQLISLVNLFSLDPLFVGMTIGAFVPSIPNIAAAYKATKKGLTEVAVSETIGSNVFTLLVTTGIIAMISPIEMQSNWLTFDIPVVVWISFLLFIYMISGRGISRKEGFILFSSYLAILVAQIIIFL